SEDFAAGPSPVFVVVVDVNGDRLLDLVVVNSTSNVVSVLLGNGNGTFQAPQSFATGTFTFPRAVAVEDVDGDGKLDLVVANSFSFDVSVLLGNGDGTFQAPQGVGVGGVPADCGAGDSGRAERAEPSQ